MIAIVLEGIVIALLAMLLTVERKGHRDSLAKWGDAVKEWRLCIDIMKQRGADLSTCLTSLYEICEEPGRATEIATNTIRGLAYTNAAPPHERPAQDVEADQAPETGGGWMSDELKQALMAQVRNPCRECRAAFAHLPSCKIADGRLRVDDADRRVADDGGER